MEITMTVDSTEMTMGDLSMVTTTAAAAETGIAMVETDPSTGSSTSPETTIMPIANLLVRMAAQKPRITQKRKIMTIVRKVMIALYRLLVLRTLRKMETQTARPLPRLMSLPLSPSLFSLFLLLCYCSCL